MLGIVNPQFPESSVLMIMLLAAAGIVLALIVIALGLAILTWIMRLLFVPKVRYKLYHNGIEQMEMAGFEIRERSR